MMTITLPSELERIITAQAQQHGTTPEQFALETLRQNLLSVAPAEESSLGLQDEWEVLLRRIASPAGVSLSEEAVSRDNFYE